MAEVNISKAWGYGAVVVPARLFWQGFIILDPRDRRIEKLVLKALAVVDLAFEKRFHRVPTSEEITHSLAAVVVEAMTNPDLRTMDGFAAGHSSALAQATGRKFYLINGKIEPVGTTTQFVPLEVETPEAARDEIDRRVRPLKMGVAIREMAAETKK